MHQQLAQPAEALGPLAPAVCLHGMWRCGSTFVWSRFREDDRALAFYEPLAPGLDRLTRRRIPRDTPEAMAANRHPVMAEPYFAEYAPLLGRRGVRGFRPGFTFDRFALSPGEAHRPLAAYLRTLVDHAAAEGRCGVLGFNQTGLRIGWLKGIMEARHIQVERDPRAVFASYLEHLGRGNYTYFRNWMLIVERNAGHPLFAPLAERLPIRRGRDRLRKPKAYYADAARRMSPQDLYLPVAYLWLACALHALSTCDLVIDTGLASQPGYALSLSARIAAQTGLQVDLSALAPAPYAAPSPIGLGDVERLAASLLPRGDVEGLFDRGAAGRRLSALAPRSAEFLAMAL